MRKSVAEQLAELATPAPAADPEAADDLDDGPGLLESDEELAAHTKPAKHAPEKRHRHADIALDSAVYRGRKTRRQDIFNDGLLSALESSGDDSDTPEADSERHGHAVTPNNGHRGATRQRPKQPAAPSKQASIAEIAEDEWGSDGEDSDGGLGELPAHDSESEDVDASDSGGSEEPADDGPRSGAAARRNMARGAGRGKHTGGTGDAEEEEIDTGSEEEEESDMNSGEDDDMSDGEGHEGMEANLMGSSDEDDEDEVDKAGWAQLEADFATIQATPAKAKAPTAGAGQAAKAAAVATQVKLWEKALGVRISLQRGLIAADRIPRGNAYSTAIDAADGVSTAVDSAKREAVAVFGECMDAMHELIARTVERDDGPAELGPGEDVAAAAAAPHACEAVWPAVEALEARFAPFRDEEIDRWHRRTLLASGQVAMRGGGGLQALNQPLSHQVSEVLRNPDRAMARTRRRRQAHERVLCEPAATVAAAEEGPGEGEDDLGGRGEVVPGQGVGEGGREVEADVDSYDDSAFYQLLLHEFLEVAETDGRVSGVAQVPKSRKVVDRRASKGRKVRYHVMQKLVNFMVPVEDKYPEADDRIDALLTNLFGHKTRA